MIVEHGANFEGEAPPFAPTGRHDMVQPPPEASATRRARAFRSNGKKSGRIKILEQVLIAKVCQLLRNLL